MSDGGFLRGPAPSSSYSSSYSGGGGQSRAEPEQTPQQRDEEKARADLVSATQLAAAAKKLDQVPAAEWPQARDKLAAKVEAFAAGLKSSTHATENGDRDRAATVEKVAEARKAIEHAKPPRAVPPVAGEEAIEPRIADKSIAPEDVIDWMGGLSKSERETVWRRYKDATSNRADTFAVALANYVSKHRDRKPPLSEDLRDLATMRPREHAEWQADRAALTTIGQSKPLDPLGQSHAPTTLGQSFADPARDADHDGRADTFTAPTTSAPTPPAAPAPAPAPALGQSRPLDPLGQSHAPPTFGQSFADPARDADHDGRADLFVDPATQPSAPARQLAADVTEAIASTNYITDALIPSYATAIDALDLAAVGDAAASAIAAYKRAATLRAQLRAQLDGNSDAAHAVDHGLLMPLRGALDAALAIAEPQLASGLGVQQFRGQPVMPGVAPLHLLRSQPATAAAQLTREAGAAQGLIATVHQVAELVPTAADATAAGVSEPTPHGARTAAERIRVWAGRPVHLAFLKAALSDLGIWQQLEHATIPGDGRTLDQLDQDVGRDAARFGAMSDLGVYNADLAASFLIGDKPSRENVAQVLELIETAAPDARGPILADLDRRGLLERFAARLKYDEARRLHDTAAGNAGRARSILRDRYGEDPHTGDNTLSNGLRHIPLVGGALDQTLNVFTFGFLHEHDEAHRRMQSGEISEDEYVDASNHALLRATAVGAVSTVTGGAASAYVEGLTASVAARGVAGRIAATTASGAAGGAVGNMGARLGSDAVEGDLSSLGAYGHDAAIGGAIGGGIGFGASSLTSAAKYLPEHVKTPVHRLLSRLPSIADDSEVFGAIRSLGESDAHSLATFTADATRITELAALRVVTLSSKAWQAVEQFGANTRALGTSARNAAARARTAVADLGDGFGPQMATANGAPARFRFTAEAATPLNVPGPDGPVLHILEARSLGDDFASHADDLADEFGGRDAVDMMAGNEPRRASFADESPDMADDFADDLADDATEIGLAEPTPSGRLGNRRRHVDAAHTPDELGPDQGFSTTDNPHEVWAVAEEGAQISDRHHIFPQSSAEKAWFAERGINVDDFTVDLSKLDHQMIHGGEQTLARKHWPEREWRTRIMRDLKRREAQLAKRYNQPGRKLRPDEIWKVADRLRAEFGIDTLPMVPYDAP